MQSESLQARSDRRPGPSSASFIVTSFRVTMTLRRFSVVNLLEALHGSAYSSFRCEPAGEAPCLSVGIAPI